MIAIDYRLVVVFASAFPALVHDFRVHVHVKRPQLGGVESVLGGSHFLTLISA